MPDAPKKQFRAKPMPDFSRVSIMSLGPTCSVKQLTTQEPFNLNTEQRSQTRDRPSQITESGYTFKAREAPKFRPISLTPTKSRSTIAVMPPLASELRASQRSDLILKTRTQIQQTKEAYDML